MNKKIKAVLSVLTIVFSMLSAGLGYGFMGVAAAPFPTKLICGFVFIMTPLWVVQLVIELYRKGKQEETR